MSDHSRIPTRLINLQAATSRYGCKRVKYYDNIKQGLMTPPIRIGSRFARWPEHEVEAIVRARIAGANDFAVRALVNDLLGRRSEVAADA